MGSYQRSYAAWAEAFAIFHQYPEEYAHVSAEHDVIYAGPNPEIVSEEHKLRLSDLHWQADTELGCFYRFV